MWCTLMNWFQRLKEPPEWNIENLDDEKGEDFFLSKYKKENFFDKRLYINGISVRFLSNKENFGIYTSFVRYWHYYK